METITNDTCNLVYIDDLGTSCCRNILKTGKCHYGDKCYKKSYHKLCETLCEFNRIINEKVEVGTHNTLLCWENKNLQQTNKNLESLLEQLKTIIENIEKRNNKLEDKNKELEENNNKLENRNKHLETLLEEIILNNNLTN